MDYSKNDIKTELNNLTQQIEQLKMENQELISNLYQLNERLRESESLKGHFISNVTNEIVNPFASVLALSENIKSLNQDEMPQAHHMADLIFNQAFHLDFQLKNIFAAALFEAGKSELNFSDFNLIEQSEHIANYFRNQLDKKRIYLNIGIIPADADVFHSDKEKLDLILKNLISNSIKYSPKDSTIRLILVVENGQLTISLSDQGKGINEQERKIIFNRFKQLDEKINSINTGHGLGLSIVQAYAELLGGKVEMENNDIGGIKILVVIPESDRVNQLDDLDDFILDSEFS